MISIRAALGNNPELEAEILLCYVLGKNRAYLFAHPEELLTKEQYETYQSFLVKRAQGIPIAYITGEREFWSLNLKVNTHTLIPRHETELLVELALEKIPQDSQAWILELGTGSGAIAIAIAKERPNWNVIACDFSQEALQVAQENAQRHQVPNLSFHHSNWYSALPKRQYHAIISNPPYIAEQDPHLQEGDLRFEPRSALASAQDGLADLHLIIEQGYDYLLPNGLILLEHGYDQKLKVRAILNELGYKNVQCWKDLQGHDRVSGGWR
ncbi:peptide chain release factor N(5)-glutamine methyltransferase [Legionella lytica]|uniref:Release factor glutamine methyltransferase n=1 Tax=Legionella lytica TaxID=96232 RepID=A0ABY4YB03_9GAMM|nr:peptide chain release factor N(5)-glutamine methyltransferase [Legionella lytica]USQ14558.1 peptide chain release factor N(5)-glutamine methyltransferase [Legionella lytica]